MRIARALVGGLIISSVNLALTGVLSHADCIEMPDGEKVVIEVSSCKEIVADQNKEVRKFAGDLYESWNLRKAYTGALIKDKAGSLWKYPSEEKGPCKQFRKNSRVEKRGYHTCCDTGRWGKCVFGGQFLGDIDAKPINTFQ